MVDTQNIAIELKKLSKTYYGDFWKQPVKALLPLDLQVFKGEAFGFVGPNGAGKTTTIKILTGLQTPSSGEALLFQKSSQLASSRNILGFLPERPYFYTHLTAREVLNFYGQLYELSKEERSKRIEELLERVAMTDFADVPLQQYSKGMLQRIGLCQTLLHRPKIIVLDEPMSGLDPLGRALVRDIIVEEKNRGTTVFFSSHVLSDVEAICTRVAILVKGQLRNVGPIETLIGNQVKSVECLFEGPNTNIEFGGKILTRTPTQIRISCSVEEQHTVIQQAVQNNLIPTEVKPLRIGLEEFLVQEIQKTKKHSEENDEKETSHQP